MRSFRCLAVVLVVNVFIQKGRWRQGFSTVTFIRDWRRDFLQMQGVSFANAGSIHTVCDQVSESHNAAVAERIESERLFGVIWSSE
jgi:hypothetical protein